MSLLDFVWNASQERRIGDASIRAGEARASSDRVRDDADELRRRIETLSLACQALWEVVRSQHGLSDEVLLRKIEEIDLRDGKLDGAMGATSVNCSNCGRSGRSTRQKCMYCGTVLPSPHIFERN
jgi:hypothetical protein